MRQTMVGKKRFGVDIRLLEELRTCQLNRKKKSKMFERPAIVSVNNVGETELMVKATRGRLTIVSTCIRNVRLPVQVIDDIDDRTVEIVIDITVFVRIRFSSATDTNDFKRALGNLAVSGSSESSEDASNGSLSTDGSETSISSTDQEMLASRSES